MAVCRARSRWVTAKLGLMVLGAALLASCTSTPPPRPRRPPVDLTAKPRTPWPRREVLDLAVRAYRCAQKEGVFHRPRLTVVDYSLPSREPRLWVIDLSTKQVLHHELVAHGEGSGLGMAVAFSNRIGSHQSSLGLFRTESTYSGRFGYSLRLSGLEPGVNDRAYERDIVVHGLSDVNPWIASQLGTIGNSWGCLAVPQETAGQIIDSIAGGSAVFAYYPDSDWLQSSRYLNCDVQLADRRPQ